MGLCASVADGLTPAERAAKSQADVASHDITTAMEKDHKQDLRINKLLLLGAGESGKSTLFKQMINIYGKGFTERERVSFTPIIYNNIVLSMKSLVQQSAKYADITSPAAQEAKEFFDGELKGDEEIDPRIGEYVKILWADPAVQATYDKRASFQLLDSASFFFDRVDEIMQPGYIPSNQDVLRSRASTTGIVENDFEIDGNQFKMFDVGGQRNERKKWIHCFENVTVVLFVAAISEYDQTLYEDDCTNRMEEALNLFEEICNSKWFKNTAIILFLNKRDLFKDKIEKVSLSVCFPDYDLPDTYDDGCEFLLDQFEAKNHNPDKKLYTHITCATDTNNIEAVFDSVKDVTIGVALTYAGLV